MADSLYHVEFATDKKETSLCTMELTAVRGAVLPATRGLHRRPPARASPRAFCKYP